MSFFFFFFFFSSMSLIKRLAFSESFVSHRRKVFSGFSLGIAASLLIISFFFLSNSLRLPKVEVFLPQFDSLNNTTNNPSSSSSGSSVVVSRIIGKVNVSEIGQDGNMKKGIHEGMISLQNKTLLANLTDENLNNVGLHVGDQQGYAQKPDGSALVTHEKGSLFDDSNCQGLLVSRGGVENSSMIAKDLDLHVEGKKIEGGEESMKNSSSISPNVDNGKHEGDLDLIEKRKKKKMKKMQVGLYEKCDIFDGKWVRDDSKPYYPLGSCPLIDRDFDCHLNGRPDSDYVKWKWQPNGCNIPSLNATDFLERLRGQRLVFVGDSLNRNMWESLVCILRQSIRNKKRVFEISGNREFKKKGVYAFRFEDYNCSVDFVVSPFIVQESTSKGKNGSFETLRLDLMDHTTNRYKDADIIVFNTGHWWTHEKTSKGEDYYQEGNHVYPRLKVLDAYTRALTTWARWVDQNIDANHTQVFFRGYSSTHFWGGQWNSGGQCHKETEPIFNETYLQKYPSKMWALEHVIQKIKTPVVYMNISRLTDYRKDGHPSIYRKEYKTSPDQNSNSTALFEDCSHWCLPGVPDTWNELLYVSLLKHGKGSWKSLT